MNRRHDDGLRRDLIEGAIVVLGIFIVTLSAYLWITDTDPDFFVRDAKAQQPGLFVDGFESPPLSYCESIAADPQLQPEDWRAVDKAWDFAWRTPNGLGGKPVYPYSGGHLVPVGARRDTYTVIGPFFPVAGQVVKVDWVVAQGNSAIGYRQPRPADYMHFAISPCPGDLRRADTASSDGFLQVGCRRGGQEGSITFHALDRPSDFQSCQLIAGEAYYMTVVAANPEDGLQDKENTCSPVPSTLSGCDVNASHAPTEG